MTYDQAFWEALWSKTVREHADKIARHPPNAQLVAELSELAPGRALDAGCGHGAETLFLAARGWHVTALDFSATALAQGRAMAEALGPEVATRIRFIEADLASWRWVARCSWSVIVRSIRRPVPRRPQPVRCKSRSRAPSPRPFRARPGERSGLCCFA